MIGTNVAISDSQVARSHIVDHEFVSFVCLLELLAIRGANKPTGSQLLSTEDTRQDD
jgi:hypothetical protein